MKRLLLALPCIALAASAAHAQTATTARTTGGPIAYTGQPMPPYSFDAGPRAKDWEVTFGAAGASQGNDFGNTSIGVSGSLGYYWTKNIPVRIQQTIAYGSRRTGDGTADTFAGSTLVFASYQFDFGKWQPLVGFGLGGNYGNGVRGGGLYAIEAGVKYFFNESTFVYALPHYGASMNNGFSRGAFAWLGGLGVTF